MTDGSFRVGVIDLGTNAVRLQIARVLPGRRHELIAEEREPVRLGEGLFVTGELGSRAMARTIVAIGRFAKLAKQAKVHTLRAVATAAVREAHNRNEFLRAVARETGVALEVISGAEEARLVALGVLTDRGIRKGDHVLCDIGGGSTELTLVKGGQAQLCWSLEIGAVRLTEMFLIHEDPPGKRDVERLRLYVRQALAKIPAKLLGRGLDLVGSAGTIGAIAEILSHRGKRQRGAPQIDRDELEALANEVVKLGVMERRALPGCDEKRAEILLAGCILLLEVMDHAGVKHCIPTKRGLRDGLVVDLVRRVGLPLGLARSTEPLVEEGLRAFVRRCGVDELHADRVARGALVIFDAVEKPSQLEPGARPILHGAAMLHDVGKFVAYERHHKHAYYLIANAELPGYSDHERELVANVARYHRKSTPNERHPPFVALRKAEQEEVRKLSAILRVADALDRTSRLNPAKLEARVVERELRLVARMDGETELEQWAVEEKAAPAFEEAFGLEVKLEIRPLKTPPAR